MRILLVLLAALLLAGCTVTQQIFLPGQPPNPVFSPAPRPTSAPTPRPTATPRR